MTVCFDCGFLSLLMHPAVKHVPHDPITGEPTTEPAARVEYLIDQLETQKAQIIVPTPVLSEFLVRALDAGPAYLAELKKNATFRLYEFDQKAAIECAKLEEAARTKGNKRGSSTESWQKVKIDRQIVAIAIVSGASRIYTDDNGILNLCADLGFAATRISECPLRPVPPQLSFDEVIQAASSSTSLEPPSPRLPGAPLPSSSEP